MFSCSVNQQISLNPDGSGRVESSVFMEDFFLTALKDLTALGQAEEGKSPLDPDSIAEGLAVNPYFSEISVHSSREGEYSGALSFHHIEELFDAASGQTENPVISHRKRTDGKGELILRINDDNFQQIFQLFPVLKDPGFQYFLPEEEISREEYREMLLFIFEDGAPELALKRLIDGAALDLIIKVEGEITEQTGGRILNPDTLQIHLPLLDLLLHENELYYSLIYIQR